MVPGSIRIFNTSVEQRGKMGILKAPKQMLMIGGKIRGLPLDSQSFAQAMNSMTAQTTIHTDSNDLSSVSTPETPSTRRTLIGEGLQGSSMSVDSQAMSIAFDAFDDDDLARGDLIAL
jgi:hypothetical protein